MILCDADQWLSKEDSVLDSESGNYVPVEWRSQLTVTLMARVRIQYWLP